MAFDGTLGFLERWNHRRPLGQHPPEMSAYCQRTTCLGSISKMSSTSEVGRYRTGSANLLGNLVGAVGEIERSLDVDVEGDEASARAVLQGDPTGAFRITCAVLLRKAKIHMVAMLRANENNNVHSLAVQMRPVLECAGQVLLVFHNLMIEQDVSRVLSYMNEGN